MIFTLGVVTGIGLMMALRVILYRINLTAHRNMVADIEKRIEQWQN